MVVTDDRVERGELADRLRGRHRAVATRWVDGGDPARLVSDSSGSGDQ